MTLFKQLFIGVSLGFLFLVAGIELIYISNARTYLQDQLASHSQDAATSLAMMLSSSMADGDVVRAETVVNAIFDRGYYQSIRVISARGETVVNKSLPATPPNVPGWFVAQVKLEAPVAESMISKGWRQLGRVVVSSHPMFSYQQLWHNTVGVSFWLLVLYMISLAILHFFLKNILRPLAEIEQVAHAISERDFKNVKANPKTRELRTVVKAINILSSRIHSIIDAEVSAANHFRLEAHTDELTKLDNRRSFEHQVQAILDDYADLDTGALYLIQIANFKEINSSKGYQAGDNLLKLVGAVVAETWADHNFVRSRINGATFAIAGFNISREEASGFGMEISIKLSHAIESEQCELPVTFGCGGTFFRMEKASLGGLMAEADLAMLQSISQGDNKLVLLDYSATKKDDDKGSLYWKQLIENALTENRFALLAQPLIAFTDSIQLQYEVVGRLIDGDGELIPAAKFMPMAVRHGLVAKVDRKLLEKIFNVMNKKSELTQQIAVNLSIRSINDAVLMDWLNSILTRHRELSNRVIFEFSEFGLVQDIDLMGKFVEGIRKLGSDFAVDNFGLHHSAFAYLQSLRPSYIKLNPIFTKDLLQNRENQFFISSVVKITKPLEIKIFAHGIENEGALELLNKLGVDGYQGYATGIPIRID